MRYTRLGNTGLIVSRLAFGAMTFTAGNKDTARSISAQLDAATPLAPVYPNWFIDRLADQQIAQTPRRQGALTADGLTDNPLLFD
jgi:hypothetical protein